MIETKLIDRYGNSFPEVKIHDREWPTFHARLATSLIERWGLVMAVPDGEDSTGRQRGALMPVVDVVARACDTADQAIAEFRSRGWLIDLPSILGEEASRDPS